MPSIYKLRLESILEELASLEHKRWAHWQKYMHEKSERLPDGSLVIPADLVKRWERQIVTDYKHLSEPEKESDRQQVREYLDIILKKLEQE